LAVIRLVVVGGGIIGLCTAHFARRLGAEVTVVESATCGAGCSYGNAGWICPGDSAPLPAPGVVGTALRSLLDPDAPLHLHPTPAWEYLSWLARFWRRCNRRDQLLGMAALGALNRRTLTLYDELAAEGIGFEMHRTGLLHAHLDAAAASRALERDRSLAPDGYRMPDRVVTGSEVRELEPALGPAVAAAYLVEEERHVRPDTVTRALATGLVRAGALLVEHTPARGAVIRAGRLVAITTDRGPVDCDRAVVAVGAQTARWLRPLRVRLPMLAGKGYSFTVPLARAPQRAIDLVDTRIACSPMSCGVRLAGTMEIGRVGPGPEARRIAAMILGSRRFLADWPVDFDAQAALRRDAWAGLRPMTADGLPVLDAVPKASGLYVATGHAMEGMILGPASGEAMAEFAVTGRRPQVLWPFSLERFI